jgi:integrase
LSPLRWRPTSPGKGGKEKELPVHHKLEELLDQYLKATGLEKEPDSPVFPAAIGKTGKLSRRPLARTDAADMLKRQLKQAGLPAHYLPHSFRATGITNFLGNDGTLEAAQQSLAMPIAGPPNSMTAAVRRFCSRTWRGFDIELQKRSSVRTPDQASR